MSSASNMEVWHESPIEMFTLYMCNSEGVIYGVHLKIKKLLLNKYLYVACYCVWNNTSLEIGRNLIECLWNITQINPWLRFGDTYTTVTVKYRAAGKLLFLYFNLCLGIRLNGPSYSFASIFLLTHEVYWREKKYLDFFHQFGSYQ